MNVCFTIIWKRNCEIQGLDHPTFHRLIIDCLSEFRPQMGSPLSAPSAATAALENEDDRAVRALREINEFDGGRALDADMEDDVLIAY